MLKQELILKLVRFGIVGGTVTLVFMGLTHWFAGLWGKQIGFLVAYPIAVSLHFTLNKWWTFGNHARDVSKQVGEYIVMVAVTFALQWVVYTALTGWTTIPVSLAAALANVAQIAITYFAMDRRIFRSKPA